MWNNPLIDKFRLMSYDELANLGIKMERIIERGNERGASSKAEQDKLFFINMVMKEKEQKRDTRPDTGGS